MPLSRRRALRRHHPVGPSVDVRRQVGERSNGWCEVQASGCQGRAVHYHHKLRRSQGGQHTADNLINVCASCHDRIHQSPAWAQENGWLHPSRL